MRPDYGTYYATTEMKKTIEADPLLNALLNEARSSNMSAIEEDRLLYYLYTHQNRKWCFARHRGHSIEVIELLLKEEDTRINVELIKCQEKLPESWLEEFAKKGNLDEKIAVAKKTRKKELLEFLANEDNEKIKAAVGENEYTGAKTIIRLAQEKSLVVKKAILDNHNITIKALEILLNDESKEIRSTAEFKALLFLANSEELAKWGLWQEMAVIKQVKSCYHTSDRQVREQVIKETRRIFSLLALTVK